MRVLWLGIISGLSEVRAHKLRSFLTLLGIVLGAAALVGMLGVVKGMMRGFETMIYETGGLERINVVPHEAPEEQREIAALSPGRTIKDVEAIVAAVPLARRVTAEVTVSPARLHYQGKAAWQQVRGVMPATFTMDRFEVERGRMIGELDLERQAQVIVLGSVMVERLFALGVDPLGTSVQINGQPFTVIGVLPEYRFPGGGRMYFKNAVAFIPLTTAQTLFRIDEKVDSLSVQVADVDDVPHAVEQLSNVLRHTHRGVQDFRLETREEMLARFEQTRRSFVYSLGGVAAIGLVVGGIGIMNVMLASINERVRELGVRRALGARRFDILVQILFESSTLALTGGLLGIAASVALVALLQKVMIEQTRPELSPPALVLGVCCSAITGILAGIYPALRASRLSPVEALRSE
jgi:putative ABC transport system permease protein